MIIDIELLEKHGYTVEFQSKDNINLSPDDFDSIQDIGTIHIRGVNPSNAQREIELRLHNDFPEVDDGVLRGIAYRAIMIAQGQDIIRICAKN